MADKKGQTDMIVYLVIIIMIAILIIVLAYSYFSYIEEKGEKLSPEFIITFNNPELTENYEEVKYVVQKGAS
jgi:hypothetical protein